jgi:uncharacterized protein YoxC
MTADTLAVGLVIIAAELAVLAVGLYPVLRHMHRSRDEWAQIVATVEALRADVDRDIELWEREVSS